MNADDKQALVEIAEDQWETAASYLQYIEHKYRHAINVLKDAMESDPEVIQAREDEKGSRELLDSAREIAKENQEK